MRHGVTSYLLLSTLLLCSAPLRGQDTGASPAALTENGRREAFFRKNLVDAYETTGHRNPAWDANARNVLKLAVRQWTAPKTDPDVDWQIAYDGDQALTEGCDDPSVLYNSLRAHTDLGLPCKPETLTWLEKNVSDPHCAPFIRVFALVCIMDYPQAFGNPAFAPGFWDKQRQQVYDAIPAMVSEQDFPLRSIVDVCTELTEFGLKIDGDRKPTIDKINDILAKAQAKPPLADLFNAEAYKKYAWDARGKGFANTVTDQGAQLFSIRLTAARNSCQAALDKDPHCSLASDQMISIELGLDVDGAQMEKNFQSAIRDDPDDFMAYDRKLFYLTPKWHGDPQTQFEFGRECLSTKRWDDRIPFLLLQSHLNLSEGRYLELSNGMTDEAQRLKAREQALSEFYKAVPLAWPDAQSLYEEYLAYCPDAVVERIDYAKLAMLAGNLDCAAEQMLQVSANTDPAFQYLIWQNEPRSAVAQALRDRGMSRQAIGNPQDAVVDLQSASMLITPDNWLQWYMHVWIWMAQVKAGDKAQADRDLDAYINTNPPTGGNDWPPKIIAFFRDRMSEADFLAAANASPATVLNGNLCEAWYYAGIKRLMAGDRQTAKDDFIKCIGTQETTFVEFRAAHIQLQALEK